MLCMALCAPCLPRPIVTRPTATASHLLLAFWGSWPLREWSKMFEFVSLLWHRHRFDHLVSELFGREFRAEVRPARYVSDPTQHHVAVGDKRWQSGRLPG